MSLIDHWIVAAVGEGADNGAAARKLNADLGTAYSTSRFGEWRNGRVPLPKVVSAYMLSGALPGILRAHGVQAPTGLDYAALADDLLPPSRA